MVVQAVVDHDYIFGGICVGCSGSVHDTRIFASSMAFHRITQGELLSDSRPRSIYLCQQISVCIIGDSDII